MPDKCSDVPETLPVLSLLRLSLLRLFRHTGRSYNDFVCVCMKGWKGRCFSRPCIRKDSMRKLLVIAAGFSMTLISQAGAQVTLVRQPLWLAGSGDCNHAVYNNMSSPCSDSSPTGDNDSEYVSYLRGLIFQPRISGLPSYFTQTRDLVLQGKGFSITLPMSIALRWGRTQEIHNPSFNSRVPMAMKAN